MAEHTELTDGFANAVWRLRLDDGREVVCKLSPPPELDQLSYERNLLRMEASAYELAAGAGVPVATLLCAGFDDPVLGGDYLMLGVLDGVSWNDVRPDGEDGLRRELGRLLARLNAVTGEVFGYPHAGITGSTWRRGVPRHGGRAARRHRAVPDAAAGAGGADPRRAGGGRARAGRGDHPAPGPLRHLAGQRLPRT